MVQLAGSLLWAFGFVVATWLLLRFAVEPSLVRKIEKGAPNRVVALGTRLGASRTLRGILMAAAFAFSLALASAFVLSIYIDRLGADAESGAGASHSRLIALRDAIEQVVDRAATASQAVWLLAIVILALIWIAVSRSGSRRRWTAAYEARLKAVNASVDSLSPDDLDSTLAACDREAASQLARQVDRFPKINLDRISAARSDPVLALGEKGEYRASLDDLARMRVSVLQGDGEGERTPEENEEAKQAAARIANLIKEAERQIKVSLLTISGEEREYSLAEAERHAQADPSDVMQRKRFALVDAKMRSQDAQITRLNGREPELISEWVGAAATSGAAVKGVSRIGQAGAFVAMVAIVLSFLGVSAGALGPGLILRAQAYEIGFVDAQASLAVKEAQKSQPAPEPAQAADLASDEATVQYIRASFRAAFSAGLRQSLGINRAIDRAAFEIGAIDTRREILRLAARNAAPSVELGAMTARETFVETHSPGMATAVDAEAHLDKTIDRRIAQLRQNEGLWMRFRREALTPVPPHRAAEALLRTALGDGGFASEHAFRVAADRAAGRFVADATRFGSISKARAVASIIVVEAHPSFMTTRDQRLIGDFRRTAPQHVETVAAAFRSGDLDPGSIHRVAMGVARAPVPDLLGTVRPSNMYAELFPAAVESAADAALGGGAGPDGKPSAKGAPAARSFARIRFSGKVGGVVIGREPDAGGEAIDVVGFEWSRAAEDSYGLALKTADGRSFGLGPFHPALIYGALAYAADGRVVTSTLPQPIGRAVKIDGLELNARRVLVHPALEDTSVACPAIQIDRFVDTFTGEDPGNNVAAGIWNARLAVKSYGEILGTLSTIPMIERFGLHTQIEAWARKDFASYVDKCGAGEACFPIKYYEKHGLNFGNSAALLQCLAAGGDCTNDVVSLRTDYSYLVDSGVREQSFTLDRNFDFLTGVRASNPIWPLDFIVQAIPQRIRGEEPDIDAEFDPWIFPAHADDIRALVQAGIESNPAASQVLDDMKDFVVLQRLFRLALSGSLGFEFPVHRLPDLQRQMQPAMEIRRHERWNVNASIESILRVQAEALVESLDKLKDDTAASEECRAATAATLGEHMKAPWPSGAGIWPRVGLAAEACKATAAGRDIEARLERLRDLDLVNAAVFYAGSHKPLHCDPL